MKHPLYIVDVFAEMKYEGNQLAVIIDSEGFPIELMQKLAREVNFSETTFITTVDLEKKVFKVRIFTKEGELPFAGHPTLGTAYIGTTYQVGLIWFSSSRSSKRGIIPDLQT